jgi:hypothetical protein
MSNDKEIPTRIDLDQTFLEMRWRCLSLAADLDRLDRAGAAGDPRLAEFRGAVKILLENQPNHAERVQLFFSDPISAQKI